MIRFIHANPEEGARYTLGYEVTPAGEMLNVKAAIALCGPLDAFNKKIGRNIVIGRLSCEREVSHVHKVSITRDLPTSGEQWRLLEAEIEAFVLGQELNEVTKKSMAEAGKIKQARFADLESLFEDMSQ